jgi:hypothetical protein
MSLVGDLLGEPDHRAIYNSSVTKESGTAQNAGKHLTELDVSKIVA